MNDKTCAYTILSQLGGNLFCMMVGVKTNVSLPDGLMCRFKAKAKDRINKVMVKLNGNDLYDMEFFYSSIKGDVSKKVVSDVYCDDLATVFSDVTGLATKF